MRCSLAHMNDWCDWLPLRQDVIVVQWLCLVTSILNTWNSKWFCLFTEHVCDSVDLPNNSLLLCVLTMTEITFLCDMCSPLPQCGHVEGVNWPLYAISRVSFIKNTFFLLISEHNTVTVVCGSSMPFSLLASCRWCWRVAASGVMM